MTLAELIEAGRELTPLERVKLADELLDSVEETDESDPEVDAAWQAEFRRRLDDVESGRVQLVDGPETMRIARERIAERRATHRA